MSECLAKANVVGEGGTKMVKNGGFGYLPRCLWWTPFLGCVLSELSCISTVIEQETCKTLKCSGVLSLEHCCLSVLA